jgi:threonine aldolase
MKSFASDNYAGVLPEVMTALKEANIDHAGSYGNDLLTHSVAQIFKVVFDADVSVHFVFNGTGANVLSISAATQSYNAILCADTSHIYNDESSAPETFTGCRFFPLPTNEFGKLELETVRQRLIRKGDLHFPQIKMLSLTQSTEYGTVYSVEELTAFGALCKEHGLYFHIDGSRFFNAAASLGMGLSDISTRVGVDILSLGGTKLGMMFGEAVVVFNPQLNEHLKYKHKQVMQLASKTRFIAAQYQALFKDDLWRKTALRANAMAQKLFNGIKDIQGLTITRPVTANVVFATLPNHWNESLTAQFPFYVWRDDINEVRLMCAWDTREEEIDAFIKLISTLSAKSK